MYKLSNISGEFMKKILILLLFVIGFFLLGYRHLSGISNLKAIAHPAIEKCKRECIIEAMRQKKERCNYYKDREDRAYCYELIKKNEKACIANCSIKKNR